MKRLSILLLTLSILRSGHAQNIDRTRLDSLFDNLAAHNLALGDIAITQNGKPVYQRTVGKDQNPGATYRVGSISKVFTATMIYELIDTKQLSLDDTLGKFFPDVPNAGTITIAELLGHRSGLANFTAEVTGFNHWKEQPHTHEQLTGFIKSQPPDFVPGKKADYNNSNFLLLGYILEKICHQSYKDLVTERIIQKLGLRHTYYGDRAGFRSPEVPSFKYADNQWKPENAVYLDNFGGAGAMISTPQDLCQFITAIFKGKFIGMTSLARMTRIENDGYGWGMFSFGDSLHTGYGHSGQTEGFASSMRYFPKTGLAICYCTNGEVYPKDYILDEVFGICFGEPVRIPTFIPVHLSKEQEQPLTGNYTGDNVPELTCSLTNDSLSIGIKGQQFPLEALSDHEFRNVRFGFFFEFDPANKQLVVHDAATTYWLHRR